MKTTCTFCGNPLTPQQIKDGQIADAKTYTYRVEGIKHDAKLLPMNDAFFEVVSGKHKGNLVHSSNVNWLKS
jgi:hypothetical protein